MEKGSMVALKRVNGALVRVSAGWSGSMGVLKRINAGIGQGQWGY